MTDVVERGRQAFDRRAWAAARSLFVEADGASALDVDDLERLAVAAYLMGDDEGSARAWERAHRERLAGGDPDGAARCAFWLALGLLLRGEPARAAGWLGRAHTVLDGTGDDCVAAGYLRVPASLQALMGGDHERAAQLSAEAGAIARRFGDADLWALALLGRGEACIAAGDVAGGVALLDEVMVSVTAGEVSVVPAGIVYCAVIEACMGIFDLPRAAEWTEALGDWCAEQPELVPYRGQCLVHRAQVLHARGAWEEAIAEAQRAQELLSDPPHPALGAALYEAAELHRVRGSFDEAEQAYREANRYGRHPMPGLALLRLAQGRIDAAVAGIRRALDEEGLPLARPPLLAACTEIALAAGDAETARRSADELDSLASRLHAPFVEALAGHARGSVLLEAGEPVAALAVLRAAGATWRRLDMPYEAARSLVLVARACRALGDEDAADVELAAATAVLAQLGARTDLPEPRTEAAVRVEANPLTAREREVLALVAAGRTNREVAAELVISEHTVARHLQNTFAKLGVSSRAAAVAHAVERRLLPAGRGQP